MTIDSALPRRIPATICLVLATLLVLGTGTRAHAQWSWVETFSHRPSTGTLRVDAIAEYDGSLFLAGFPLESLVESNPNVILARRLGDGTWESILGRSVGDYPYGGYGQPSEVRALLSRPDGLIVGGSFESIGDRTGMGNVARWAGGDWHYLGNGIPQVPWALGEHDGRLYAGTMGLGAEGEGTIDSTRAVLWEFDGAAWNPIAPPPGTTHGVSRALLSRPEGLWVGGSFLTPEGPLGVLLYDGTTWHRPGGGLLSDRDPERGVPVHALQGVAALTEVDGEVFAGGSFHLDATEPIRTVARFDGTAWQPTGAEGSVEVLVVQDGVLHAIGDATFLGSDLFARFDGVAVWSEDRWFPHPDWEQTALHTDAFTTAAVTSEALLLGGVQRRGTAPSSNGVALLAHRDGVWRDELDPSGSSGLDPTAMVAALHFDDRRLTVGGRFTTAAGRPRGNVAVWSQGSWEPHVSSLLDHDICPVEATVQVLHEHGGELYAGGSFLRPPQHSSIAMWSGSEWEPLLFDLEPVWNPQDLGEARPASVHGFLSLGSRLVVVGKYEIFGSESGGIAAWDGQQWSAPWPMLDRSSLWGQQLITDLVLLDGRLVLGGSFSAIGGEVTGGLVGLQDGHWVSLLTEPEQFGSLDLAVHQGSLYLAGRRALDPEGPTIFRVADGELLPVAGSGAEVWRILVSTPQGLYAVGPGLARVENDALVDVTPAEWPGLAWQVEVATADPTTGALAIGGRFKANPPFWGNALGMLRYDTSVAVAPPAMRGTLDGRRVELSWSWPAAWRSDASVQSVALERRVDSSAWVQVARFDPSALMHQQERFDEELVSSPAHVLYRLVADLGARSSAGPVVELRGTAPTSLERSRLVGNYPNPFNPTTTLELAVERPGPTTISIYSVDGRRVRSLLDEWREPGFYEVPWNGMDDDGQRVPSGTYLARLRTVDGVDTRKLTCIK